MIIASKADKHDNGWRIVLYDREAPGQGSAVPKLTQAEFHDEIDIYYEQRQLERDRLFGELMDGKISPVGFYLQLQGMEVVDVAKRTRLRSGLVRRHMTPGGFASITVEQLARYARVFDVSVGDFFWFAHKNEGVAVEVREQGGGLLQFVELSPCAAGIEGESA